MVDIIGSKKFEPRTAPTPEKGVMYYDIAADKLKVCEDGSTFQSIQVGELKLYHTNTLQIIQVESKYFI